MADVFFEPESGGQAEIEIKKSRFIGTVKRIVGTEDAKDLIQQERASHPSARHVVFAYLIGGPRSEIAGMSDDGEPKGTAGRPVLEVLKGSGIRNALVTVTRYFGGTKLGTGGLVKAYTECAQAAIQATPVRELRQESLYQFEIPYDCFESVKYILRPQRCRIAKETFDEIAVVTVFVPDDATKKILDEIRDASRGRAVATRVQVIGTEE